MTISRAKAGFAMIAISIVFFFIADSIENLETQLGIAAAAFVEDCLFIVALALIGLGIYLACFSKPCPVCAERLSPAATDCEHCGYNFDTARLSHRWKWLRRP
jgi:hypothetical protein